MREGKTGCVPRDPLFLLLPYSSLLTFYFSLLPWPCLSGNDRGWPHPTYGIDGFFLHIPSIKKSSFIRLCKRGTTLWQSGESISLPFYFPLFTFHYCLPRRIRNLAGDRTGRGDRRRTEKHLGLGIPHPALEIPVRCGERLLAIA